MKSRPCLSAFGSLLLASSALVCVVPSAWAQVAVSPPDENAPPPVESIVSPSYAFPEGGSGDTAWLSFLSGNNDILGVHRFSAQNGSDTIRTISVQVSAQQPIGAPIRIAVWQDDGSGNFSTATLLTQQTVNVITNTNGEFNTYLLSTPANVTGTFYVGAAVTSVSGTETLRARFVGSNPYTNGNTLIGVAPQGTALNSLPTFNMQDTSGPSFFGPTFFLLRASSGTSGFTYQGELKSANQPFNGLADVRFRVFRSALGNDAFGPVQTISGVNVANGLFTVNVPADPRSFLDAIGDTFLEVAVRPSGPSAFTTLTPRQRMSSAPTAFASTYALEATTALTAQRLANNTINAPLTISAGDPGVPPIGGGGNWLTVQGGGGNGYIGLLGQDTNETGILFGKPTGSAVNAGIIHNNTATPDGLQFRTGGNNTNMVLTNTGRLGIGNTNPGFPLDVSGRARLRGESGVGTLGPGFYLSSPIAAPVDRAFVGMRDDSNVGFFGGAGAGWALTMNTATGYLGLGRQSPIGSSKFDIETNAGNGQFGGMYVNTTGPTGWPFYGYARAGGIAAFTWIDTSGNFVITNGSASFNLSNNGLLGLGTSPSAGGFRLELPNVAAPAGQGRANAWVTYSSKEFKQNIETLNDPLGTLAKLRGVSFDWKATDEQGNHAHDIGFIAEEVASVLPELVTRTTDGKATGLDYGRVVPVAVEAIKAQQQTIKSQERDIADLKARLDKLEKALEAAARR